MSRWFLLCLGISMLELGCSGASDSASTAADLGDEQTPPRGQSRIEPWIAQGFYRNWKCEPASHPARPPGAHGPNRVCSNDLLSAAGPVEFPVGSSSVKEIYSEQNVVGYAISRHTSPGTSGNTWYWYERVGTGGATDAQGAGVCTGCHSLAGPARSGHDFVYTQVR